MFTGAGLVPVSVMKEGHTSLSVSSSEDVSPHSAAWACGMGDRDSVKLSFLPSSMHLFFCFMFHPRTINSYPESLSIVKVFSYVDRDMSKLIFL